MTGLLEVCTVLLKSHTFGSHSRTFPGLESAIEQAHYLEIFTLLSPACFLQVYVHMSAAIAWNGHSN